MTVINAIQRLAPVVLASLLISACGLREDPARALVRERLKQDARMSNEEIGRALDEVARTIAGKTVGVRQGGGVRELDPEQRDVVLGMLTRRAGVYDEGLRPASGGPARIINAPGLSVDAEYQANRRLWIDVETLRPIRFDFSYDVPGIGEYSLDLVVSR